MVSRPTDHSALHDGYLARRPLVAIITCFNLEQTPSSKSGCQNLADDARPNLAHIVSSLVNLHTGSCSDHFADHWLIFTSVILGQSLGTLGLTWSTINFGVLQVVMLLLTVFFTVMLYQLEISQAETFQLIPNQDLIARVPKRRRNLLFRIGAVGLIALVIGGSSLFYYAYLTGALASQPLTISHRGLMMVTESKIQSQRYKPPLKKNRIMLRWICTKPKTINLSSCMTRT